MYLGYVVKKLMLVTIGIEKPTDRDSFTFKRVDLSGFLLANLFRESYKQFQRDLRVAIETKYRFNKSQYKMTVILILLMKRINWSYSIL